MKQTAAQHHRNTTGDQLKDHRIHLGKSAGGEDISLSLETLLRTRLLITASSGGGKTELIRMLVERVVEHVQVIILDPEGEYATLRTAFPFVLAGKDGDTPAHPASAERLAHFLLEHRASAICDIYELNPSQRSEFVKNFLDAMIDAPKHLWHDVLFIVDEAHMFAPEKGMGESAASESMASLASRGRKRGYCPVFATQNIAKFSNQVASECQNLMIGRTTQLYQKRAADLLNLPKSGKEREDFMRELGRFGDGQFVAWGRIFGLADPTRFQADRAHTKPPKHGAGVSAPPKPPDAIRALLPQLADLPAEAEKKRKTEEELRAELREANGRIRGLESQLANRTTEPQPDPEVIKMLQEAIAALQSEAQEIEGKLQHYREMVAKAADLAGQMKDLLSEADTKKVAMTVVRPAARELVAAANKALRSTAPSPAPRAKAPSAATSAELVDGVTRPQQRILEALAELEAMGRSPSDKKWAALFAGVSPSSGSYANNLGALRTLGLVDYPQPGTVVLTPAGRKAAGNVAAPESGKEVLERFERVLENPQMAILRVLHSAGGKQILKTKLAETVGVSASSGSYANNLGALRSLGLIEYGSSSEGKTAYAQEWLYL